MLNTTAERIRDLRQRNKLTLDDVARYLGIGRQAIYKYEQGTVTNIPLENIEKMAVLFHTTPGYIACWDETDPVPPPAPPDEPQTSEARILAKGIDKLPKEQREQALAVVKAMFAKYADYFNKENEYDA